MAVIFTEGFETDGNGTRYTTLAPEFTDGSGDFFTRTDGNNIGSFYQVAGATDSFYFAGMDLDGEGGPPRATLEITGIDISGFTDLAFSGLFAEDDDGANQDWDADSLAFVEVQIDGGGFTKVLQFASQGATNTEPGLDSDFDGIADGVALTDTFAQFNAAIAGTGSTLDLRITLENFNAGDEDIAFDDLTITGTPTTQPSAWINEFHYDNDGSDTGEFIEIAGPAGLDLTGWSLVLYNGNGGAAYNTIPLTGVLTDTANGFGFTTIAAPGLQNGAPDGIALVDDGGNVVEFLSYEGSFTAVGGPGRRDDFGRHRCGRGWRHCGR
jgi:hypothetical protein